MHVRPLLPKPATPHLRIVMPAEDAPPRADLSRRWFVVAIAAVLVLAFLIRLDFILRSDFPLNDGGLFFTMARDLQHAHYALPAATSYNGGNLPFAYPPLGIYVAAFLNHLTPLALTDVFRVLPLAVSALTIAAFVPLARSWLPSRTASAVAVLAFALFPRGFIWMIMGGGVTRSFGFLFAILAVHQIRLMYLEGRNRHVALAALFAAAALLSHLEMAWFVAFTALLLFAVHGRSRRGLAITAIVGAAAVLLSAPWWATVMAQHGLSPFLAASHSSSPESLSRLVADLYFRFGEESLFPVLAASSLLGILVCLARRRYLLPVWLLMTLVLDLRAYGTVSMIPLALLVGLAFDELLLPLLAKRAEGPSVATGAPRWLAGTVVVAVALYASLSAALAKPYLLTGMTSDERAAMQWTATHTAPTSRFAIVSGDRWAADRTSEWFPSFAGRASVVTPQGYEWVRGGAFRRRADDFTSLQKCASRDADCVAAWSDSAGRDFDYLYLPKLAPRTDTTTPPLQQDDPRECCARLRASMFADPSYEVVYDGAGATIFRRR